MTKMQGSRGSAACGVKWQSPLLGLAPRKLDMFEGNDFRRWQKKMHFLRTMIKFVNVLSTHMPEFVEDETLEHRRKRCKRDKDDYIWRGHILNEYASSKKFLVSNFNNYKMVDSRSVMEQYYELFRILGQFSQHGLNMDESISMSSIMEKLPPSWKDFKHSETCHACKDRSWLDTFHLVQDGSVLHMGDESTKPLRGRGNVILESRKTITLLNVVYVPGLGRTFWKDYYFTPTKSILQNVGERQNPSE
ncbi:hypothetical protein Tco_0179757 [Tanacetum coccineum]